MLSCQFMSMSTTKSFKLMFYLRSFLRSKRQFRVAQIFWPQYCSFIYIHAMIISRQIKYPRKEKIYPFKILTHRHQTMKWEEDMQLRDLIHPFLTLMISMREDNQKDWILKNHGKHTIILRIRMKKRRKRKYTRSTQLSFTTFKSTALLRVLRNPNSTGVQSRLIQTNSPNTSHK